MLINFCDSAFAIGRELIDPNTRYLKQIKQRNYNEEYGEDNVAVFRITKPADFLQFEFTEFSSEHELLKKEVDNDWDIARAKAIELAKSGLSQRRIAVRIDVSPSTVCRMLKEEDAEV